jgi:hypothetical protein
MLLGLESAHLTEQSPNSELVATALRSTAVRPAKRHRAAPKDQVMTTDFTSLPECMERLAQPADMRAIDAVWMAPGVHDVRDQLVVTG